MRMTAISNNLANISTTHNEAGEAKPYQPRYVVFQTDEQRSQRARPGVKVSSVETCQAEPRWRYQPGHPDAVKDGPHAGIRGLSEHQPDDRVHRRPGSHRAYEANVGAIEVTKDLCSRR